MSVSSHVHIDNIMVLQIHFSWRTSTLENYSVIFFLELVITAMCLLSSNVFVLYIFGYGHIADRLTMNNDLAADI